MTHLSFDMLIVGGRVLLWSEVPFLKGRKAQVVIHTLSSSQTASGEASNLQNERWTSNLVIQNN